MDSLPDEWGWLDELPPSWIKLVGEYVAARSELTIWVAQHDPPKSFKEKYSLAQLGNDNVDSVYRCWLAYSAAFRDGSGRVGTYEDERAALITALQVGIKVLRVARGDRS